MLALIVLGSPLGTASDLLRGGATEYEIKAAFVYNFVRFVNWPEDAYNNQEDPFQIGILGADPFGNQLDEVVAGRTIDGRSIVVNRSDRMVDLVNSHLLFISASEIERLEFILNAFDGAPVLTVADIDGFAARGGIVEFFRAEQRIAFKVNLSTAERGRLSMSSRLLNLAAAVYESPGSD